MKLTAPAKAVFGAGPALCKNPKVPTGKKTDIPLLSITVLWGKSQSKEEILDEMAGVSSPPARFIRCHSSFRGSVALVPVIT